MLPLPCCMVCARAMQNSVHYTACVQVKAQPLSWEYNEVQSNVCTSPMEHGSLGTLPWGEGATLHYLLQTECKLLSLCQRQPTCSTCVIRGKGSHFVEHGKLGRKQAAHWHIREDAESRAADGQGAESRAANLVGEESQTGTQVLGTDIQKA